MLSSALEDALGAWPIAPLPPEAERLLLDLEGMGEGEAQRAVDFVSGGVVAMDGQTERLGERTFLFTPASVQVEHDLTED